MLEPLELPADFEFCPQDVTMTKQFMTTNYSNGDCFKGLIRNLRVYGLPVCRAVTLHVVKSDDEEGAHVSYINSAGVEIAKRSFPIDVADVALAHSTLTQHLHWEQGHDTLQLLSIDGKLLDGEVRLASLID